MYQLNICCPLWRSFLSPTGTAPSFKQNSAGLVVVSSQSLVLQHIELCPLVANNSFLKNHLCLPHGTICVARIKQLHGRLGPLGLFCSVLAGLAPVMSFWSPTPKLKSQTGSFFWQGFHYFLKWAACCIK